MNGPLTVCFYPESDNRDGDSEESPSDHYPQIFEHCLVASVCTNSARYKQRQSGTTQNVL